MAYEVSKIGPFTYDGVEHPARWICCTCGADAPNPLHIDHHSDKCKYGDLETGFWKDYYEHGEGMPIDEFMLLSDRDKDAYIKERRRQMGVIHKKWQTHLWMESKMKGGDN